jgi:hypothetical protein
MLDWFFGRLAVWPGCFVDWEYIVYVDPLLGNDSEITIYITAVAK